MNLNLVSYLFFFPTMVALAIWVARTAHRNGEVWLMEIFQGDGRLVRAINDTLLIGCYVVNIGYIALVISRWGEIESLAQMLALLSERFALIVFTLAFLHYMNISVLLVWARYHRQQHGQAPHVDAEDQAPITNT